MGLIQASLLSINHNLRNEARDEAVRVAANSMGLLRSFRFDCGELDPTGNSPLVNGGLAGNYATCRPAALTAAQIAQINNPSGNFRNFSLPGGYTVTKGIDNINANTKKLAVRVQWKYPGETDVQSHTIYYTMGNTLS